MTKWRSLTWVFLKTTLASVYNVQIGGKSSKFTGPVLIVTLGLSFALLMFYFYMMIRDIVELFAMHGQIALPLGLVLNLGAIIIFVFSFMAAPPLFYFSKDVEYLLPLPIKPQVIIGSKFTMALLFEYAVALVIMVPLFAALLPHLPAGGLIVGFVFAFLTLPILPMVYSTVLTMVMVRFFRFGRNPDRYTLVIGVVVMIAAVGFSTFLNSMIMVDPDDLIAMLMGEQVVFDTLNFVFITNSFSAMAIAGQGNFIVNQVLNLGVAALSVIIFFWLAGVLYFKGVIGLSESGSGAKKMTRDDIMRSTGGRGVFSSYLMKELRLLFRSPTAFLNSVLTVVLVPVILVVTLVFSPGAGIGDIDELLALVDFSDPRVGAISLVVMSALGMFIAGMGPVTASAISREGANFFIMKYLPVRYSTQINAKAASGLLCIGVGIVVILVPLQIILRAPLPLFLGGAILTLPGAVAINYFGLLIDLARPKLTWDNEQAAVKNNMNVMVMMFGSMALAGAVGVGGIFLLHTPGIAFAVLMLVTGGIAVGVYLATMQVGARLLRELH